MVDEFFAYMIDKADKSLVGVMELVAMLLISLVMFVCVVAIAVDYTPWLIPLGMIIFIGYQVKGFLKHRKQWNEDWEKKMKESANDPDY